MPFWGLALVSTSILFLAPLIYKTNQKLIDTQLENASTIINKQTEQVKAIASQQAARATETTKSYVGDYSAKAQEMIGNVRGRSSSPIATTKPAKTEEAKKDNVSSVYKNEDFPAAPKEEFKSAAPADPIAESSNDEEEPLIST
jgi:cell wall-associated NlpC family hydrolase